MSAMLTSYQYKIVVDNAHAWLRVPLGHIKELAMVPSSFSYRNNYFAYLEEDCDMVAFSELFFAKCDRLPVYDDIHIRYEIFPGRELYDTF